MRTVLSQRQPANDPGWKWSPQQGRYLWWDGERYTARADWDGSQWQVTPAAPSTPRRRYRWWVIVGAVILGVTALGIAGWGIDRTLTHDLLSEDFSVDDGAFASGERSAYEVDVHEGTYRMTVKSPLTFPIRSFGWFARTAYYVDIDATVVSVEADHAAVGVECVEDVNADSIESGYAFMVFTDGSGYALTKMVQDAGAEQKVLAAVEVPGVPLREGQHVGISCGVRSLMPNAKTTITGSIDGVEVIEATDGSFDSFDAAGLVFFSREAGDSVQFDDVTASVPE
jgi:hypothetical protein